MYFGRQMKTQEPLPFTYQKHSVFSRDMTLGVLVSLFETKNQTMLVAEPIA